MLEKWGGGTLQRNDSFGVLGSALCLSQAFPQLGACGCALGAGLSPRGGDTGDTARWG